MTETTGSKRTAGSPASTLLPRAEPEMVGMSSTRLGWIVTAPNEEIEAGQFPGAVVADPKEDLAVVFMVQVPSQERVKRSAHQCPGLPIVDGIGQFRARKIFLDTRLVSFMSADTAPASSTVLDLSRSRRLLDLVCELIDYGKELANTAR